MQAIIDEITQHHSSYYIDHSIAPAPMLMSSGFTDDLFPANETIRFYNRTRTQYPDDAHLALFFGDFGHPRAQNKDDVTDALIAAENAWMDFYVKGEGAAPTEGVTAYTLTCPNTAPSGGPYTSGNWAKMAKGEIRFESDEARTIEPGAGSSDVAAAFNPVGGGGACATADGADQPGTATYRLDPAPAGGYTLMGSATVIADLTMPGDTSQVAARLLDVGPDGKETLVVARDLAPGERRPDPAGVPAVPERLDLRRGPRAEARAAAEGHQRGAHRRLRARLQRPAADHGLEPAAAPAGDREAGLVQGPGRRRGEADPARRATSWPPTSRR